MTNPKAREVAMSREIGLSAGGVASRWRHIARFLNVDEAGNIGYDFLGFWCFEKTLEAAERAAANDEWADYFEYRLVQRAGELAGDRVKRHLVEEWTDSMVYLTRRCATYARGEDPGPWLPQHVRRPDIAATGRTIADEIMAELEAEDDVNCHLIGVAE
jgi:hypothetical protein